MLVVLAPMLTEVLSRTTEARSVSLTSGQRLFVPSTVPQGVVRCSKSYPPVIKRVPPAPDNEQSKVSSHIPPDSCLHVAADSSLSCNEELQYEDDILAGVKA